MRPEVCSSRSWTVTPVQAAGRAVRRRHHHPRNSGRISPPDRRARTSFVVQHHRRDRRHRLGHRVDAKDRALGHRRARLEILHADSLEVGELAVAGDSRDSAGDFLLGHELLQQIGASLSLAEFRPTDSGVARGKGSAPIAGRISRTATHKAAAASLDFIGGMVARGQPDTSGRSSRSTRTTSDMIQS